MHDKLLKVVRTLETDYEPHGKVESTDSDCSCGCRHFVKLGSDAGNKWGVCANPESPRAGLLTFEHQGCAEFEPILFDRNLTDSQLRGLIAEASEILKDRRGDLMDLRATGQTPLPDERGEFLYDVRTSHHPHIKGHNPVIFRLEPHDGSFVAIPLVSRTTGGERPIVMGRYPAKNGEVFKIVRTNGEYSYQVPFNGKLYNLKQYGDLSDIGIFGLEALRQFLECVEPETFEKIISDTHVRLKHVRRWQNENEDHLRRWKKREFWTDETPASKREYREMLKEAEEEAERLPTQITEKEAFIEWLKGVDRSAPKLRLVPPPPVPQRQSTKR
jgi:DNA-directed RNA polymerase subunit H (RpoH/RPB5)